MSRHTLRLRPSRLALTAAACLLSIVLLPVAPVRAGVVITVTAIEALTANDGGCSLREAILAANADAPVYAATGECPGGSGTDTIRFATGGVDFLVYSQLPAITTSMTIDGGGDSYINATGAAGAFRITGGTVRIQAIDIRDTAGRSIDKQGGSLTLSDVRIYEGIGDVAIANEAGAITITGSSITSNSSPGVSGGGLYNAATATIADSTFGANGAVLGGGVYNAGTLTIRRSTFSDNTANFGLFGYGGGALVNHGTATVTGSTFRGNRSDHPGGAIANHGTLTMANVTLASNVAGGGSSGGAIYNAGSMTIANGTLTLNASDANGDGIWTDTGATTVLKNTIVAGNTSANGEDDLAGTSLAAGSTRNVIGPFAGLGTYLDGGGAKDNGGPTPTVQVYARTGSPFIDKGSATVCASTVVGSKDQRGVTRPSACDIGAVEHERAKPVMTSAPKTGFASGATLTGTTMPGRASYAAKDNAGGSGIKRYVLSRSVSGGAWSTLASGIPTRTWNVALANGKTYRFRVRAVDYDGNSSTWAYGSTFTARLVQDTSSSVTFSSGWFTRISSEDSGGRSRYAQSAGRSVKVTFTGRAIALVGFRSYATTTVKVYIDGSYAGIVRTDGVGAYRALTWTKRWNTVAAHTVRLVVADRSAPLVYVDAFAILK